MALWPLHRLEFVFFLKKCVELVMALQLEQETGLPNYQVFFSTELDNKICEKLRKGNALPCLEEE